MSILSNKSEKENDVYPQLADPLISNEILERISDAFIALDNKWCYTYMNKKAGEIFNSDPKQIIGKYIWTGLPEAIDQPFYKACHKAMEKQEYTYFQEYYEPSDLWFENHIYPSRGGLSIFLHDITDRKKTEAAILKTKSQYQTLAEISPVGIFHTDAKGHTTYVNKRWCQISGLSFEQALGDDWLNAVHSDDKEDLIRSWHEASQVGNTSFSEYRFVRADGTIAWVMGHATPRKNDQNETVGYVGTITDITERKRAEEVLNQNRIFIESIINASPDIIYIYDIEERKNIYVNEGIQKNLHYTSDEIKQMGDQLLRRLMHPEDFEHYVQNIFPKYINVKDKEMITHEVRMQDKNQQWHWLYCKESVFLRTNNGMPKQLFGIAADITEAKKIENEIAKEKNLSDSVINSLPGIFYLFDHNGKYLRWNKNLETVSGYTSEEIENIHPLDFFCEDEKELLQNKIATVFDKGMADVEACLLTKSQQKIHYYFNGWRVLYEDKPCVIGVGIDITELKNAEEELGETSQQLRKLTTHLQNIRDEERKRIGREIHDELGQQLTAVKMDVAWIDKKIPEESTLIKTKLKNIITLLDTSNVSVRKILHELRADILDSHGLKNALEWQARQFTSHTGIPIIFDCSDLISLDEPVANCIFRVFQEALTNITKYADAKKVISSLYFADNKIVLEVKDDGKGFDTGFLKKNDTFGILGIRERVTSLNGKFDLASSPEKGTRIVIAIPV
jgi:PAS domain S-box-containing protein